MIRILFEKPKKIIFYLGVLVGMAMFGGKAYFILNAGYAIPNELISPAYFNFSGENLNLSLNPNIIRTKKFVSIVVGVV
jgi:hypothetical protein